MYIIWLTSLGDTLLKFLKDRCMDCMEWIRFLGLPPLAANILKKRAFDSQMHMDQFRVLIDQINAFYLSIHSKREKAVSRFFWVLMSFIVCLIVALIHALYAFMSPVPYVLSWPSALLGILILGLIIEAIRYHLILRSDLPVDFVTFFSSLSSTLFESDEFDGEMSVRLNINSFENYKMESKSIPFGYIEQLFSCGNNARLVKTVLSDYAVPWCWIEAKRKDGLAFRLEIVNHIHQQDDHWHIIEEESGETQKKMIRSYFTKKVNVKTLILNSLSQKTSQDKREPCVLGVTEEKLVFTSKGVPPESTISAEGVVKMYKMALDAAG